MVVTLAATKVAQKAVLSVVEKVVLKENVTVVKMAEQ